MSSFNKKLNENMQFIIAIKVIKCPTAEEHRNGVAQNLIINTDPKRALIDTGATNTCISQEYANELQLIPIGKTSIRTAGNNCYVNRYKIDFAIPVARTALQTTEKDGKKITEEIIIGEEHWAHAQHKIHSIPAIGKDRGFDVILGMDILSKMHITMFNSEIIMSF